jgi:serine/threonine protein kinase
MELPETTIKCIECGTDVPIDARTLGLCPRCMLGLVIDARKNILRPRERRPIHEAQYQPADLAKALPQFHIQEMIGRGGMGIVYRAIDRKNRRPVALKILPIHQNQDVELLGRFISEARILTSLHHPNIVEAYESGQTSGFMYLAMQLIEGKSLREQLKQGPVRSQAVVEIATQVCDALTFAHERGIIHRDIKPENILLDEGLHVRLVDFGLARPFQPLPQGASPTAPNQYVGTADYIAPEFRYRNQPADARADIYSLGVVMYEMLCGRLPIGHFPAPSAVAQSDKRLDKTVLRCLATDPLQRYASAAELRHALTHEGPSRVPFIAGAAALLVIVVAFVWINPLLRHSSPPSASELPNAAPVAIRTPLHTAPTQVPQMPPPTLAAPPSPGGQYAVEVNNNGFGRPFHFPPPTFPVYGPGTLPRSRMIDRFGADHVIKVTIHGLAEANRKSVLEKVGNEGGHNFSASYSGDQCTAYVGPYDDVAGLAKEIDFGTVSRVDSAAREIDVQMPADAATRNSPNNPQ